ncbi:hypothetical protein ID866_8814 [Astraeus odoratus]|nr:hypothetical protein ID866_8814 [Astraeus odoratus]
MARNTYNPTTIALMMDELDARGGFDAWPELGGDGFDDDQVSITTNRTSRMPPINAYTFKVELIGSRNPVITRTFTVPATWTFRVLHGAIQHAFGWEDWHLHHFTFKSSRQSGGRSQVSREHREQLLRVHTGTPVEGDGERSRSCNHHVAEEDIRLRDIWEEEGSYRPHATKDGRLGDCYYLYDDKWDLQVTFVSSTTLDSEVLKVIEVQGASPLEDVGGIRDWNVVKKAFAALNPNEEQNQKRRWARALGGEAYDPTVAPTVSELNAPGAFEKWLHDSGNFEDDSGDTSIGEQAAETASSSRPQTPETFPYPAMPMLQASTQGSNGPPIHCTTEERRFNTHSPDTHPLDLFTPAMNRFTIRAPRFVHTDNTHMASVLVYSDGVVLAESTPNVRAGCGVYFAPDNKGVFLALEDIPGHARTIGRAELRAALMALELCHWPAEGFRRIVIGASSEYVVKGACEWVTVWRKTGWRGSRGKAIKNRDLWEMLFKAIDEYENMGVRVQFYLLKKEWNTNAHGCAMQGAVSTTFFQSPSL